MAVVATVGLLWSSTSDAFSTARSTLVVSKRMDVLRPRQRVRYHLPSSGPVRKHPLVGLRATPMPGPGTQEFANAANELAREGKVAPPLPGADSPLGILTFVIVPAIIGIGLVYLTVMFRPEAVLKSGQIQQYNESEKRKEERRRGKKSDGPSNRAARRRKLREGK